MPEKVTNRWLIAAAGVVMQIALGAVYAWSVFRKPLSEEFDASVSTVNVAFTLTIVFLGLAAYFGGLWMGKVGPRKVAMTAGLLYGAGVILASLSSSSVTLLYLTYGVIAGIGIGLGYIVPIATLIKWFPDKRGVITGIAVAGFGAGAVLTAPIAKRLISGVGVFETFAILGVLYAIMVVGAALFIKNPPEGYKPEGWEPEQAQKGDRSGPRLRVRRGRQDLAVVRAVVAAVPQRDRRHRRHLRGRPDGGGDRRRERDRRGEPRVADRDLQRRRALRLGRVLGRDRAALGVPVHVRHPGRGLLHPAERGELRAVLGPGLRDPVLLRRRLRHDAGLRGGLLRLRERRPHLRPDAHGVERGRRGRPAADLEDPRLDGRLRHGAVHHRRHDGRLLHPSADRPPARGERDEREPTERFTRREGEPVSEDRTRTARSGA